MAHDFNNLLRVIVGSAEFLTDELNRVGRQLEPLSGARGDELGSLLDAPPEITEPDTELLAKPFPARSLVAKVGEMLAPR